MITEQEYQQIINGPTMLTKLKVAGTKPLHLLYNYEFRRPVAATVWLATANSLVHRHINCYLQFGINHEKNQFKNFKLPRDWDSTRGWEWQYDIKLQQFSYAPDDIARDERAYFQLTFEKSACLDKIHYRISNTRRYYVSEINAQHNVYRIKAEEAKKFLDNPCENPTTEQFPFLVSYADINNSTVEFAAREILMQSEFTESRLMETEVMRVKYSRAIHDAKNILELRGIMNDFYRETLGHAST